MNAYLENYLFMILRISEYYLLKIILIEYDIRIFSFKNLSHIISSLKYLNL